MTKFIDLKINKEQQFVALVVFFSSAMQLAIINVEPFWRDELFSIVITQQSHTIWQLIEKAAMDSTNGPLYPMLHYYWLKLVGPYEIGLRLLSLIFASCSIPLLYYSVKNVFSTYTAKLSIVVFVMGGKYVAWAIVARSFSLTLLLCMAVLYLYTRFYAKVDRKIAIKQELLYIVTMLLLALSHYYGILFIIALAFASVVCYPLRAVALLKPYFITATFKFNVSQFDYRSMVRLWQSNHLFSVDTKFVDPVTSDYINIYFARSGDARRAEPLGVLDATLSLGAIQQNLGTLRSSYINQKLPEGDYKNAILTHIDLRSFDYDDKEWE